MELVLRSCASLSVAYTTIVGAVQLPGQVRSQMQFGNEETRYLTFTEILHPCVTHDGDNRRIRSQLFR